ncbi:MAG TPA: hypothetical protein VK734_14755 [Bradyrhizobium sp.]|jgi:hypothetical protein|nr:hypothetical protein [Bradyrhizobium sp.]
MGLRNLSDGFQLSQHDVGRDASSTWLSTSSSPFFSIHTGDNGAGNGGDGYFSGDLIDSPYAAFEPQNVAQSGPHGSATAHQTNVAILDQSATQTAGVGGHGGDDNAAVGGSVSGSGGSGAIATGDDSAGVGGDGVFQGSMVHAPVAVFSPVNIAVAGSHGSADAHQSNSAQIYQPSFQFAGNGGSAGNGNTATGGDVSGDGTDSHSHSATGTMPASDTMPASGSGPTGLDSISSGDNHAGNGGDGYFSGSMVHTAIAIYDPINIAVAGYDSTSHADQSNNVVFDQSAVQMAGNGGNGGNGNTATGGEAGGLSSLLGLVGSDVIATGGNSAGSGGDGHFSGSLVDLSIAIYAPINIAVAGPNSTADAHQTNNVEFDQGAIQVAGTGGDGGHGNTALGGDTALHLLSDLHVPSHA